MAAKRAEFLAATDRLREKTRGRKQTPAEVLIREDRDRGMSQPARHQQPNHGRRLRALTGPIPGVVGRPARRIVADECLRMQSAKRSPRFAALVNRQSSRLSPSRSRLLD